MGLFQFPATVEPAADGRGVTIRAPQRATVMFVVIFGPILIAGGVLNQIFHEPDLPRLPVSTAAVGGVILAVLLGVVLTILQRRRFVRVGEQGLEVSDGLRRVKLSWSDVSNVSLKPGDDKLHVELANGDERTCEVRFITAGGNDDVTQALRRALAAYLPSDRIGV
ncbi:MAG TPA: PH domain-containing protein [Actinomycetota bacterium]|nr:PH domain-containing protein [Actinomycetota bacterium]